VRGAGQAARTVAVAVVVFAALGLVALAARSGRTQTVTPVSAQPTATPSRPPLTSGRYQQLDGGQTQPGTPPDEPPTWALSLAAIVLVSMAILLGLGLWMLVTRVRTRTGSHRVRRTPVPVPAEPPPVPADSVELTRAVDAGLRLLEDGGPGEGVIACWVQLERAAAEAGTERALPETPSELAGRLIDRHDVSSGPLLRLAELYREARYSRHELPEAARGEARAALEQVRAELASARTATVQGRR
jgi:hypothetical protein